MINPDLPAELDDGGRVVTCDGPECDKVTLVEPGVGPEDWFELTSWKGDEEAKKLGYDVELHGSFCSFECLREWVDVQS